MIREILTSQPQQTLQHINPSHQDEPFQSILTYTNNKPPYHKVIFQVIWTVKFDEQEISKDLTKDSKGLLPLINVKYILKKHPDLGKVWVLLVDENLSIPRNLVTERKCPMIKSLCLQMLDYFGLLNLDCRWIEWYLVQGLMLEHY